MRSPLLLLLLLTIVVVIVVVVVRSNCTNSCSVDCWWLVVGGWLLLAHVRSWCRWCC